MTQPQVDLYLVVRDWLGVSRRVKIDADLTLEKCATHFGERRTNGAVFAPLFSETLKGSGAGAKVRHCALPVGAAVAQRQPTPPVRVSTSPRTYEAEGTTSVLRSELKALRAAVAEKSLVLAGIDDKLTGVFARQKSILEQMRRTHRILHSDRHEVDLLIFDASRKGERKPLWQQLDTLSADPVTQALKRERTELRIDIKQATSEIRAVEKQIAAATRRSNRRAAA